MEEQTFGHQFGRGVAHHVLDAAVHAVVDFSRLSGGVVAIGWVEVHEFLRAFHGLVHIVQGQEHEERVWPRLPDDAGNFLCIQVRVGSGVAAIARSVRAVQVDAAVNRAYRPTRRIVRRTFKLFCGVVRRWDGILATVAL